MVIDYKHTHICIYIHIIYLYTYIHIYIYIYMFIYNIQLIFINQKILHKDKEGTFMKKNYVYLTLRKEFKTFLK